MPLVAGAEPRSHSDAGWLNNGSLNTRTRVFFDEIEAVTVADIPPEVVGLAYYPDEAEEGA